MAFPPIDPVPDDVPPPPDVDPPLPPDPDDLPEPDSDPFQFPPDPPDDFPSEGPVPL